MNEYEQNIEIMKDLRSRLDKVINKETETKAEHPDPVKHKYISFVKSGFRIGAGIALVRGELLTAGALFIIAELLGIIEEVV
jgi:hypothetical protein